MRGEHTGICSAAPQGASDSFTRRQLLDLAAEGIRIKCVCPACIYTEFHADGGSLAESPGWHPCCR
ncbi:hypothetical protein [Pseudoalteromonas sp. OOF1S-7]|uniref:hypothetical protein n=1 Tax=Pseudoalteromonas sp. OOF1S-7 TaxID=2917757 RepID=UPI001EF68421|nr:hypothetical protein [Pseudoalteromonas sp. OOF1S-7]MCG7535361.1 hypothetical protein [Pseudoalteromonas sp. OOF1S-7]